VSGSDVYFAGGGGGVNREFPQNLGGLGGGGDGGRFAGSAPFPALSGTAGAPNTGGGAGSGAGGSGIVIISQTVGLRLPTISVGLTYVVDEVAGNTVFQFTAGSGTISW